jgi:hypothetical protein
VKYNFWIVSGDIMCIQNFIQIHMVVVELNHADRHDQLYVCSFHAHHVTDA